MGFGTRTAMKWPESREIDWRPVKSTCAGCGKPIYGKLGIYEGEDMFLFENGDTVHDKTRCVMPYLHKLYLMKG